MKTLQSSNVDTVIVFRSSTPIVVCLADTLLMGRVAPSLRSKVAMGCMGLGAFLFMCLLMRHLNLVRFYGYVFGNVFGG